MGQTILISCLLPKNKVCGIATDFIPIALCNVIYKIAVKILTNRLRPLVDFVISPNRGAFVPRRRILDNLVVAQELIHSMSRKSWRSKVFALKADMSKAEGNFFFRPTS